MWVIGIVLLLVLVGIAMVVFISNQLTNIVISPPNNPISKAMEHEIKQGYLKQGYYESLKKEDFNLASAEGYNLVGQFIENTMPSKKYIVFCHGYGFNRIGSLKYVDIFLKEGFNVVLYDHRNSGESQGEYTTMGYYEKEDLKKVIDYMYNRFGNDIIVGTHGESMGAATVILHAAEDKRVKFVIADCPYSDLKEQLAFRLKIEHQLPQFPFLNLASLFSKQRAGFFFGQISPIRVIEEHNGLADMPIMFVHGDADAYIPTEMTKKMYQVKKGYKKLYIAKGADHAISVCVDLDKYTKEIYDFLVDMGY